MNRCRSCKAELVTDHAFCPKCGADLRKEKVETKEVQTETISAEANNPIRSTDSKAEYRTPFIISLSFTTISIFIWSYVYTNWRFNLEVFTSKLINNSFWIMLLPFLISLAFKKPKRLKVYYNMVFLFIAIGVVLLLLGYSQVKASQDPFSLRMQLKEPCVDNVIQQMGKYDVSYEIKKSRATKYCDCILEEVGDDDMTLIGKGEKELWSLVAENYKDENRDCVEISLRNN